MGRIRFEGATTLDARPEIVWDILTDYRNGHSRIVPKPYRTSAILLRLSRRG
jgi:hypothetical protein